MASNVLRAVDQQSELASTRPAASIEIPLEMVRCQRSAAGSHSARLLAVLGWRTRRSTCPMQIDAGQWSRIKSGTANFPVERIAEFCKLVNTVLVEWQAYQVGCTLVMLRSEAERRAEAERARADEAEKKLAWAMELLQGRKAA